MSRLTSVIESVKNSRKGWLYDENGNISNDVICGDIIPYLEELKDYEINVSDDFISDFKKNADNYYSYNYNDNIDKDISIWYKNGSPVAVICVHLYGDARCGFSDDFVVKMDDYYDDCVLTQLLQLDSVYQTISINDRYYADINIFAEEYEIYDSIKGETIDTDYTIEKDDILNKLDPLK
jgi:hypothetical protein